MEIQYWPGDKSTTNLKLNLEKVNDIQIQVLPAGGRSPFGGSICIFPYVLCFAILFVLVWSWQSWPWCVSIIHCVNFKKWTTKICSKFIHLCVRFVIYFYKFPLRIFQLLFWLMTSYFWQKPRFRNKSLKVILLWIYFYFFLWKKSILFIIKY